MHITLYIKSKITSSMRLTHQLIAGFGLLTIFVIISGLTGILTTATINSKVETLTRITGPTVQITDEMTIAIAQMNRVLQEFSAEDDEIKLEDLRSEFEALTQQMTNYQSDILKLVDDENLLENLQTTNKKYNALKDIASKLMAARKNELATKEKGEQQRYKGLKDALLKQANDESKELISLLSEISTRVSTLNKKADEESLTALRTAYAVLIFMTILSVSCAVILAVILGRAIVMPINELSQAANKISTGDFNVMVRETKTNKELKNLTNTFNKMITSLKGMMEESPRLKQFMDLSPAAEKTAIKPEKFTLVSGTSYLIKESPTKKAYEIFIDKVTHNYQGICITRTNPEVIRKQYDLQKTPILWLSDVKDTKLFSSSDLLLISKLILDFIAKSEKSIILMDRLDYLIAKHGFAEVLKLIIKINDRVMVSSAIFLLPVDPSLLKAEEFNYLEKELQTIHDAGEKIELAPDLMKIVSLIANRKALGKVVTFKDITRELNITAPTTQRRILDLYNKGLITIIRQGRNKLLQLTPEGERVTKGR